MGGGPSLGEEAGGISRGGCGRWPISRGGGGRWPISRGGGGRLGHLARAKAGARTKGLELALVLLHRSQTPPRLPGGVEETGEQRWLPELGRFLHRPR